MEPRDSPYTDPYSAAVYARISAPLQFDAPARDLVELVELFPGAAVLDAGTGTGAVAARAAAIVGPAGLVVGVDASVEMLRWSRTGPRHALASAAIPGLPFRDARFDAVTAGFVVSHFSDVRAGVEDLRRVCRAGGRLAMSAWGSRPNPAARLWSDVAAIFLPREELDRAFREHIPWDEYFSQLSNAHRAFEESGLESVHAETRDYDISIATTDFLLSRETSMQGMLLRQRLSDGSWQSFGERVAETFQREFGDAVTYVRDVHFVVGTK